jgi:preprotein translocase subunit SecB
MAQAPAKRRAAIKILSVTQTGPGEKTVIIEDKNEQIEYILRDDDPHGLAPYLREVISTLVELGQLTISEA